jgi:hypothetical protein
MAGLETTNFAIYLLYGYASSFYMKDVIQQIFLFLTLPLNRLYSNFGILYIFP